MNAGEDAPTDDERPPPEDRTYSGDMVLLVLFFAIAAIFALLLFVNRQMDQSMSDAVGRLFTTT